VYLSCDFGLLKRLVNLAAIVPFMSYLHTSLARIVLASSPTLLSGSTRKLPPSISPTANSALLSVSVKNSGGVFFSPAEVILLERVESVFVIRGPSDFSFWAFLCPSIFACVVELPGVAINRQAVENGRENGTIDGRARRSASLTDAIVKYVFRQLVVRLLQTIKPSLLEKITLSSSYRGFTPEF
jgi:hypothetical protein